MGYTIGPTLAVKGESEYIAAMKRVREAMTYVKAEANAATSVFGKNDKSVEALTARINASKKALDVQKQAVKAAEDALERMRKNGLDESSTAYKRMQANLYNAKAAVNSTQREIGEYEKELKEAVVAAKNMATAEDKAGDKAKEMGKDVKSASDETEDFKAQIKGFAASAVEKFTTVAGTVALVKETVQKLWETINEAARWGREVENLAQTTGMSIEAYQQWDYILKKVNYSMEQAAGDFAQLGEKAMDAALGVGESAELFDALGIAVTDTSGRLKSQEQIFEEVITALQAMEDVTKRNAIASALMSTTGEQLVPILNMTKDEVEELKQSSKETGRTIDTITVKALVKLDDKLNDVAATAEATSKKTASYMIRVADFAASAWEKIVNFPNTALPTVMAFFTGQSKEAARYSMELAMALENVAYVTGLSKEEVNSQAVEMARYLALQGDVKNATDAYYEALIYVVDGIDKFTYAQKQMEQVQAKVNEAINAAAEEYVAKWTEYQQAVKATAESYKADLGILFDEFDAKLAGSQGELDKQSEKLLENLKSQVDGIKGWSEEIEKLAKRGIDQGLLQELRDMGPEAYAQVQALNNMTDSQLKEYSELYRQMGREVTKAAENANKDLARETEKALQAANVQANNQTVKMKALGVNLGKGLGDGMNLASSYMATKLQSAIDRAIKDAKKKYDIRSPSRVTAKLLGDPLGAGIGVGWADAIKQITPNIEAAIKSVTTRLSDSIPRSINTLTTPTTTTVETITKEIIRDSGFQPQFNGPIYINQEMDIKMLAEKLGYYYKRTLAAQGG